MKVIEAGNVNDAYLEGVRYLRLVGATRDSRAGKVLISPVPVVTYYQRPTERVLFDPRRDANPFFHIMEALWMLSGSRDARWLDRFVGDFSSRFAEDNGEQHGAYGYRWRNHFDMDGGSSGLPVPDQLETIVRLLQRDPTDRRVVLTMWDPVADLGASKRDIPCNTHAYFRVRTETGYPIGGRCDAALDMTVCCRSNDIIFGCYGANAVHFSVLQEYLAARLGVKVGVYYQVSNNFHAYLDVLDKVGYPPDDSFDYYWAGYVVPKPMFTVPAYADSDIQKFVEWVGAITPTELPVSGYNYHNPWFNLTAEPLMEAHWYWKAKRRASAIEIISDAEGMSSDWQLAARQWMDRRMKKEPKDER